MAELTPTHSALLELREERQSMEEGYHFLDEKRLVLAAHIMQELTNYEKKKLIFEKLRREAADALKSAITRHGLEGLLVYPSANINWQPLLMKQRSVLGLALNDITLENDTQQESLHDETISTACNPSPEAEMCRTIFSQLVVTSASIAGITRNLHRLHHEYQKTAKRARALEDILLPELDTLLVEIEGALEDLDREEVSRVRYSSRYKNYGNTSFSA